MLKIDIRVSNLNPKSCIVYRGLVDWDSWVNLTQVSVTDSKWMKSYFTPDIKKKQGECNPHFACGRNLVKDLHLGFGIP